MPFVKWTVEPVFLSRQPIPPDKNVTDELEASANITLVGTLRQLACLVSVADCIFEGISAECKLIQQRSESLRNKIEHCERTVTELNAKAVRIPLGDLTKFSLVKEHYATQYEHERDLFTPGTRPVRVRELYDRAAATPPLHVIRCLGHDDSSAEVDSRRLFLCMPVWGDAAKRRLALDLDIETRRPASLLVGKEVQDGTSDGEEPLLRLPSPEEKMHALSLEYPPVVVPIDTSESNFNRLSSVRRSLIHVDFLIKRKKHHKRRNTISDGNSKEIEEALSSRKKSGTIVKTEALIHTSCQTDDDLLIATTSSAGKSNRSKRRSEGSPSSGDLSSSSTENNATKTEKRSSFYEAMNFKLGRDWKFLKKSSKKEEGSSKNESAKAGDGRVESGTSTGGTDKKRRSFLPISTNSAAMTVAVKLRETSARTGAKGMEDGQSSSGNWSASSSTRASVDSDQQTSVASPDTMPHSHSESSLGKDSLFSDNTHHSTDGRSHDGTVAGYSSDASVALTGTTAASSWKPGLQGPTACRSNINSTSTDPESQSGTITPEACQSDSKSSSSPLRKISVGSDPFTSHIDDGDSSVYSVDTDGYYTSMHTDSGLIKHTPGKFGEEAEGNFAASGDRGSQTSIDTIGNLSLNSFLSQNANDTGNDSCSIASTLTQRSRVPPAPPPRLCSVRTLSPIPSQKENSPPLSAGDVSESDCEVGERLRRKTSISSFRYPSICAVSPEPSDEESCRLDLEKRAPKQNPPATNSNGAAQLTKCNVKLGDQETSQQKKPEAEIVEEKEDSSQRCNMYGVQSPRKMPFLNAVVSQPDVSPNTGKQPTLGSFSSAECELTFDTTTDTSRGSGKEIVSTQKEQLRNPAAETAVTSSAVSQSPDVQVSPSAYSSPVSNGQPRNSPSDDSQVFKGAKASLKASEQTPVMRQTPSPPKSGGSTPVVSSPSYTPFYLNRPSSLMSKTRSPFLSYLSRNSPTKTSSTPSPPSPAHSPSLAGAYGEVTQLTPRTANMQMQEGPRQSSPVANTPCTSPQNSPQTSPQTTPPAVPPPPPPLTYSSKVLEQGSARLPSVTNEPNSVFTQSSSLSRVGARVTLDPEGKVIYSSNSLGRRRDGQPINYGSQQITSSSIPSPNKKYATLPPMVSPVLSGDPRAYVRLDPSGTIETYSSSTVPRTRHSISVVGAAPSKGSATTPTSPPRSGTPSLSFGVTGARVPTAGSMTPQPERGFPGRSTPQPTSAFPHNSGPSGRGPPVQRPASISMSYEGRPAGTSTPVSQHSQASSGRVTPVHHFSPISLPASTASGRRTPLQPSPREPIGPTWVSGLPPPPLRYPVASSPQHVLPPSLVQQPAQTRALQQFNGKTTPVQRYTPPSDPYIPNQGSPARGYPPSPPYFAPRMAPWDSGRTTPVQRNPSPNGPRDTRAPYRTPEQLMAAGCPTVQACRHESPATYASTARAAPVNGQAYGGRHPHELVNGRTTPVEYSYQNSAPQQCRPPNGAYPGRTTPDATCARDGAHVSILQHQNYGSPSHSDKTSPVRDSIQGENKMRATQLMTNGPKSLIPEQHGVYYGVQGHNDRQNPPQSQRYASVPMRQPLPATNSTVDPARLLGPPHVGGQYVWPVRGGAPTPAYGLNQQSIEQNYRTPEQRAFVLSGSKTTATNDSLAYADSLRNAYNSQSAYHSPSSAQCANELNYAAFRGLPKQGSPTGLSSTSLSSSGSERSPDNSSSSTSITRELQRKPMSAEDLFAVIHSSKKKHGIKTEADLAQSPLSSRSSSPMVSSRPSTPSRGGLAETGFLSPRSSRDRRSWSGDVSLVRTSGSLERRSLANDRLGPVKPTSLLDFKKLLLQTKTTSQNGQAKKSAVELLKASPVSRGCEEAAQSLPTSPVNVPSPAESPTGASWTSTVPLKRGGRIRSSLQHRYDHMYPPILEDCAEDTPDNRAGSAKAAAGQKTGEIRDTVGGVAHPPPSSTWV